MPLDLYVMSLCETLLPAFQSTRIFSESLPLPVSGFRRHDQKARDLTRRHSHLVSSRGETARHDHGGVWARALVIKLLTCAVAEAQVLPFGFLPHSVPHGLGWGLERP